MALKDLKSDLSKFRRPIEKPLVDKKRVDVPKSTNQQPLSQFVDKTPSAPKSNTTAPKQGVTPNKFDNSSNYLGETSQPKFDNSSNYLGETTPSKMSLSERFLGQTETQEVQQGDKFKGETEAANITQGDRFKGQTTPQDYSNAEKFKGETNPTEFKFTQQFLGETTPKDFSLTERFLGETTPSNFDNSSNFLGETTPVELDRDSKFLGETTPSDFNFNPKLDLQATEPKFVDFITNNDAMGFSPFQQSKNNSTFIGVDPSQTQFEGITPITGEFLINRYRVNLQNDSGLGTTYTDEVLKSTYNKFNLKEDSYNSSIIKQPFILSGIQREKGEPQTLGLGSFSFIKGGAVTATAKATIDVARMSQFLITPRGLTWIAKQVGMQRTQRYGKTFTPINLLASLAGQHLGLRFDRPGKQPLGDETWKYDNKGYLTGIYNVFKLQTKNDVLPLRVDPRGGFDSFYGIGVSTTNRKVNTFRNPSMEFGDYKARFRQPFDAFAPILETYSDTTPRDDVGSKQFGVAREIDSVYKELNDLDSNQAKSNTNAKFEQKINPTEDGFNPQERQYGKLINTDTDGNVIGNLVSQTEKNSPIPIDTNFRERGLYTPNGLIPDVPNIADYEAISYGNISKLANDDAPANYQGDFRNLKSLQFYNGVDANGDGIAAASDYTSTNLRKTYGFAQTFKTNRERLSDDRLDKIGISDVGATEHDDIVKLVFKTDSSNLCQFRGTVSGITETFSPSWNSEKPNGRADKMYMMTEFERTLSFNFKAVAYSRMELIPMWEKLKQLATFAMPYYGSTSGYRGRPIEFTLGDLWKNHTSLLTSLSYTMSDEASWETDKDYTIPKLVDISVGLTLVGDAIHSENSTDNLYDYGV